MSDRDPTDIIFNSPLLAASTFSAVFAGLVAGGPASAADAPIPSSDAVRVETVWDAVSSSHNIALSVDDSARRFVEDIAAIAAFLASRQVPLGRDIEEAWDANTHLLYQS